MGAYIIHKSEHWGASLQHVSPGEGNDPPCDLELKILLRMYCRKAVAGKVLRQKWLSCQGAPL